MTDLKSCLRDPIPEIFEAAQHLNQAVSAHLRSDEATAAALIRQADLSLIRDWTNSLWGKDGPWSRPLFQDVDLPSLPQAERAVKRMPSMTEKRAHKARRIHLSLLRHTAHPPGNAEAHACGVSERHLLGEHEW